MPNRVDEQKNEALELRSRAEDARAPYERPRLVHLGSVQKVTLGSAGAFHTDSGTFKSTAG